MSQTKQDLAGLFERMTGDEKHEWAAASTLDVLWVLAYYAVLAAKGFFAPDTLDGWTTFGSPLGHHPDHVLVPGVEISSGSLGHGLGLGVGTALGLRAQGRTAHTVVLVGDGELDEGSNHEAIASPGGSGSTGLRPSPSTTAPPATAGRVASPGGSPPRAGPPRPSTGATTAPSIAPSPPSTRAARQRWRL